MSLPEVYDPQGEPIKFMASVKERAAKNFRWTVSRSLENSMYLAYYSFVFGRHGDALEVCEFLSQFQFAGDFQLWGWIEKTVVLQSRLLRSLDRLQEATECVTRIRAAGFVGTRLSGSLLDTRNLEIAILDGNKTAERDWRAIRLTELCTVIELGGSEELPIPTLEIMFQENLLRLQELVGAVKLTEKILC